MYAFSVRTIDAKSEGQVTAGGSSLFDESADREEAASRRLSAIDVQIGRLQSQMGELVEMVKQSSPQIMRSSLRPLAPVH